MIMHACTPSSPMRDEDSPMPLFARPISHQSCTFTRRSCHGIWYTYVVENKEGLCNEQRKVKGTLSGYASYRVGCSDATS